MTRNDLPEPVDPDPDAITKALADLEADIRRMGLGVQADKAKAILSAMETHSEKHATALAFCFQ